MFFYRCRVPTWHKSIAAVEWSQGWRRGWGGPGDNFWQMIISPSPPRRPEQQQAHLEDCSACWRVSALASQGTPLLLNSTDSASLQSICHLLPNSSSNCGTCPSSSQPTLEAQRWYRWIQMNNSAASVEDGLTRQNSGCAEKIQG